MVKKSDRGKGVVIDRDYEDIDGLITNERGITLGAFFADCIPLYFYDKRKNAIGLAHSGWKGTCNKMGAVMIKTRVGLDNIVTITNEADDQMENISIIEYANKKEDENKEKEKDKEKNENSKNNIEIITSMINPKEWFEDITKRAKVLREKYFKGKENIE